ncbi:MAG: hypothetical protein NDF52_08730 [archaeon YNP-WB-062]|nr:hypothetical protein [Candidatus Culexarchaeum yellowstonense]
MLVYGKCLAVRACWVSSQSYGFDKRIRNISWDYTHKLGKLVAELAFKYRSTIVLEDLDKIRGNNRGGNRYKLSDDCLAYAIEQLYIHQMS